jgi:uncharacterized protein (DUF1501 family)
MRHLARREWLKLALKGSLGLATLSGLQLGLLPRALAAGRAVPEGYKALVCVFLYGGNDSLNMLLPLSGQSLLDYQAARQSLAVANPIALTPRTAIADGLGLHPSLAALEPLFQSGALALVGGVGSLIRPTTLAEVQAGKALLPKNLFSHNDQQATWMRGQEPHSPDSGWGARLLELMYDVPDFSSCISLAGTNLWQRGAALSPFGMSAAGVPELTALKGSSKRAAMLRDMQNRLLSAQQHPLADQFALSHSQAQSRSAIVATALTQAPALQTEFNNANPLALQLQMVAKMISVQSLLGVGRQVFFVGMGGFDTHDAQNSVQPALLGTLAEALSSFYQATVELGLSQQVTSFTMSDFGRTLSSNGDGTDHGWAGNQLVLGGAVNGGDLYGQLLPQRLGSQVDMGAGRLIPALSNSQLFGSLAQWFGADQSAIQLLLPELRYFNTGALSLFNI